MTTPVYTPPVDRLLTFGECKWGRLWPDYLQLGLGPEHVPELILMACDPDLNQGDSDSVIVYAPTHAWRALGQLRAEVAVEPLLDLLDQSTEWDDDWAHEELPVVFGMFGPNVIRALKMFLADASRAPDARWAVARGFVEIEQRHPDCRQSCVEAITQQLEKYLTNDAELNGFLVGSLVDLRAVEAAELIKEAFAADSVEESIVGDWYDVATELGLDVPEPPPETRHQWAWVRDEPLEADSLEIQPSASVRSDPFKRRKAMKKLEAKSRKGKK